MANKRIPPKSFYDAGITLILVKDITKKNISLRNILDASLTN